MAFALSLASFAFQGLPLALLRQYPRADSSSLSALYSTERLVIDLISNLSSIISIIADNAPYVNYGLLLS